MIKKTGLVVSALLMACISATACTGVKLTSQDGAVIRGRTLEFAQEMDSEIILIPRGYHFTGKTPQKNLTGMEWTAKYAVLGINFAHTPNIVDGINEKGLSVGSFYFPEYCVCPPFSKGRAKETLALWQLGSWILSSFATLDEVKTGIAKVLPANVTFPPWQAATPLHYIVFDKNGKSIVIECIKGKVKIFDNPIGVLTNAPSFDWQLTNLGNYVNMSPKNAKSKQFGSMKINQFGQGSGMLGLPGDFTPPSRFVRVSVFAATVQPQKTAEATVYQAFHILNSFDIPEGVVRSDENSKVLERTQWTDVCDLTNLKVYYRTHNSSATKMVDMKKCDLNAKEIVRISLVGTLQVDDISKNMK